MRICIDPKELNKAIKRPHYAYSTAEDILSQMSGAKYFTKLDASNTYWQIELDEESFKLLTFNSPFGRYQFLRMPYGIHSASDVCQQKIVQIINGIDGAPNSQDDIIIWGSTLQELESCTMKVFSSVKKNRLKLNRNKSKFNKSEVIFLGHKVTATSIYPDDRKVEAIKNIPLLESKRELQCFLGMINYLGKFVPNLSENTENLRKLLEKNTVVL